MYEFFGIGDCGLGNGVKQEAYVNYMIFYNSNYKSNISDNFFGKIILNFYNFFYLF